MVDTHEWGLESKGKAHVQSKINPRKSLNLLEKNSMHGFVNTVTVW